jgi:hypothetical protein
MRRPQFTLKTMLWSMAVVAIGCLGLTLERWRRIHEQEARETEAALERVRGEPGSTVIRPFREKVPDSGSPPR